MAGFLLPDCNADSQIAWLTAAQTREARWFESFTPQRIFQWDNGFISKEEYFEKRQKLEREIEALRPIDYDELLEAADLIQHFQVYWDQCATLDEPDEAHQQLLRKIVDRVYVRDYDVVGIVLHGDFGVFLEGDGQACDIAKALENQNCIQSDTVGHSRSGSDGRRSLSGSKLVLVFLLENSSLQSAA